MWDKPEIILPDDLHGGQARFHKIIRLFTDINHNSDKSEQYNGKEESGKEFFKYVPVEFLDHAVKVMGDV
jgi:hypothetical protein